MADVILNSLAPNLKLIEGASTNGDKITNMAGGVMTICDIEIKPDHGGNYYDVNTVLAELKPGEEYILPFDGAVYLQTSRTTVESSVPQLLFT